MVDGGHREKKETQPVGSKNTFTMGIVWFFPSFVSAVVIHWSFLEPFDFYSNIFVRDNLGPWVYLILFSIFIGLLVTSLRFAFYYREQYRNYRFKSVVDNLYSSRGVLIEKYPNLIGNAKNDVFVCGISLHTLVQNPRIRDLIYKKATDGEVKFKFLLHDPECKYLRDKSIQEGKSADQISNDCKVHLKQLVDMRRKVTASRGSFEIKIIKDRMPDCFYLHVDDKIYIGSYLQGFSGRDCPVISMQKTEVNEHVFEFYEKAMNDKWEIAANAE